MTQFITQQTEAKYDAIRELQNAHLDASFTIGAETSNVITVAIQLLYDKSRLDTVRRAVLAYLSDDANGDSVVATKPDGGVAAGTDGLLLPVSPTLSNALILDGDLAIHSTPEQFKTGKTAVYLINGISHTKAATTALTFSAAHVITASKFGIILVQINAAGTISTKVPSATQAYNSAPLALAALPSADAGNVALGYIAIENNSGDWTANTDDLTNASDLTTAAFTDASESTLDSSPKSFWLVSESDGDIDVAITHAAGAKTMYLILVMPNGRLVASSAITFA
jgi:hypothetical protein